MVKMKGRIGSLLEVGTGFHPELTGRENVYLNGAIYGMNKEEVTRKFDEIVAFSGVEQFIDTPVKRYSSGMYVRLGFAVAAHLDPEILIVDEVLAVGDAEFQKKCLGKMGDVASEGRTVLFVSHNMVSVRNLCQTGFVIDGGKMTFSGDIEDCITAYLHAERSSSSLITDHITHMHENIRLEQILVNDQPYDRLMVKDSAKSIKISIKGEAIEAMPLNLELRFRDSNGVPLGFYSPSQLNGTSNLLETGLFNLSWEFNLPQKILCGEYYLEIALTDPGKKWWLRIPAAVKLEVEGLLDNKGERGWIHL
jgi:lipopolysaccharide transport system ATP-binding protein